MALKPTHSATPVWFLATLLVLRQLPAVVCQANQTAASEPTSKLDDWIALNMKQYEEASKHTQIANVLLAGLSSAPSKIIKVRQDGSGDFETVNDAVKSIPSGNTERVIIYIGGGTYREQVKVDRSRPFVTFYGEPDKMPKITYDGTAKKLGTFNSATVIVESTNFVAVNIVFEVRLCFFFLLKRK